jgi:EmrB/QacA subfamily drug resistance transporter
MDAASESSGGISKHLRNLIWILVLGALAPALDTTIVNVALPTLGHALHTSVATSQWTITGYLLAVGIAMPASGWLTGRFGGKKLWLFALTFFMLGSMLSGAAWNVDSLIIFRIIQGLAAGILMPLLTTIIIRLAGGGSLGKLMSVATLPVVVVPIFGPVIGGLIIGHFIWRWIFYVNVPICLSAIILAWRKLPNDEPDAVKPPFDIFGLTLLSPALALLIYGLSQASGTSGFGDAKAYIPLIVGVVLTVCFVEYVLHRKQKPLINLNLLRVRSYASSLGILFLAGLSVYGPLLLISLFYQEVQHKSVIMTGLLLAPQGIGSLVPRIFTGKLTDRIGPRPVILIGLVLTALGTLPFVWAGASSGELLLSVALFVRGIGLTPVNIAVMVGAFEGVPKEDLPDGSSTIRIVQQIGGSFGTAVLIVILTRGFLTHSLESHAFNVAFWWAIGFTLLALIPTMLIPKRIKNEANLLPRK